MCVYIHMSDAMPVIGKTQTTPGGCAIVYTYATIYYIYIYICVYVCVYVYIYYIYIYIHIRHACDWQDAADARRVRDRLHVRSDLLCLSLPFFLSIYLSIHLSIYLYIYIYISVSVYTYI